MSEIEIIVKLIEEIKFYACFLIIRFLDFSLDFTERVTCVHTVYNVYL